MNETLPPVRARAAEERDVERLGLSNFRLFSSGSEDSSPATLLGYALSRITPQGSVAPI